MIGLLNCLLTTLLKGHSVTLLVGQRKKHNYVKKNQWFKSRYCATSFFSLWNGVSVAQLEERLKTAYLHFKKKAGVFYLTFFDEWTKKGRSF